MSPPLTILAVTWIFGCLTVPAFCVRLFVRLFVVRKFGVDDALIVFAALLSWSFVADVLLALRHGAGRHIEEVLPLGEENLRDYLKYIWLASLFYVSSIGTIKASILIFYTRLGDLKLTKASKYICALVTIHTTVNVFVIIFKCRPIDAAWDINVQQKSCINIEKYYMALSAVNLATDLIAYAMPIRMVLKLQMSQKEKAALSLTFGLGFIACVGSVVRFAFLPAMINSRDFTFTVTHAMYWSVIEVQTAIFASSIPSFRPLLKRRGRNEWANPFRKLSSRSSEGQSKGAS